MITAEALPSIQGSASARVARLLMLVRVEVQQVVRTWFWVSGMTKQMQCSSPLYECQGTESRACTVPRATGESGWTSNCSTRSFSICILSFLAIVHLAANGLDLGAFVRSERFALVFD